MWKWCRYWQLGVTECFYELNSDLHDITLTPNNNTNTSPPLLSSSSSIQQHYLQYMNSDAHPSCRDLDLMSTSNNWTSSSGWWCSNVQYIYYNNKHNRSDCIRNPPHRLHAHWTISMRKYGLKSTHLHTLQTQTQATAFIRHLLCVINFTCHSFTWFTSAATRRCSSMYSILPKSSLFC